jgi:hypothetical protein
MDIRAQRVFAWGGIVSMIMGVSAMHTAGFVPPPAPSESADQIAALYHANSFSICVAGIIFLSSVIPFLLFIAVLSVQIARIEGDRRLFTYLQLIAGGASMVPVIIISLAWSVAAFQPEQSADNIYLLNNLAFITMIMGIPMEVAQVLAIGLATLSDKRVRPIFPRWFAYASFLCVIVVLPGLLCVLAHSGTFDWDGIVAAWVPTVSTIAWVIAATVILLRAIKQQEVEG